MDVSGKTKVLSSLKDGTLKTDLKDIAVKALVRVRIL